MLFPEACHRKLVTTLQEVLCVKNRLVIVIVLQVNSELFLSFLNLSYFTYSLKYSLNVLATVPSEVVHMNYCV